MRRLLLAASLALGLVAAPVTSRADVDLWPFLVLSDDSTVVLYPFYVHEGDFLMMFPVYYRTHEGRDHHVIWPLFKVSDGRVVRVAPLWFRGENSYTLFPIIHRTPDHTLWAAPPSYFRQDGTFRAIFPLYARGEHDLLVMPGYYRHRGPNGHDVDAFYPFFHSSWDEATKRSDLFVLPTYYRLRRPGAGTLDTFFPFYVSMWDEASKARDLFVLPSYFRHRQPHEPSTDTFFPLFRSERGDDSQHLNVLFGLWGRSEDAETKDRWMGYLARFQTGPGEDHASWVLPLYLNTRSGDARTLFVLPYFRRQVGDASHSALFPLFYRASAPDLTRTWIFPLWLSTRDAREDNEVRSWFSLLWPIFERTEVRDDGGVLIERSRRFTIFSDHRDAKGGRTFKIFGLPIYEQL